MKRLLPLILSLLCVWFSAQAEEVDTTFRKKEVSLMPEFAGVVKAKFEVSTNDGSSRFDVRNSRLGVRGQASANLRYAIMIDYNNEGKISVLDTYVSYVGDGWDITIGQQRYRFSNNMDRGPNSNIFANRSFIGKFGTTYFGSELSGGKEVYYVRTYGNRDIGVLGNYTIPIKVLPIRLGLGVFNGSGSNTPAWNRTYNVVSRLEFGRESEGLGMSVSNVSGSSPATSRVVVVDGGLKSEFVSQRLRMWGAEVRYVGKRYRIEAEFAQRRLMDNNDNLSVQNTALIQGYYIFDMPKRLAAKTFYPTLRLDMADNLPFVSTTTSLLESINAQRMTVGINFGFSPRFNGAELRFNYEKYFLSHTPSDFAKNKLLQDKFTIEFVAAF